jgi:hypothetical protein
VSKQPLLCNQPFIVSQLIPNSLSLHGFSKVQKFQISEVAEARLLLSLLQISDVSEASESTRFSQFRFFWSAMALSAFNKFFVKNSFVTRMEFRSWLKQTMDDDASSTH